VASVVAACNSGLAAGWQVAVADMTAAASASRVPAAVPRGGHKSSRGASLPAALGQIAFRIASYNVGLTGLNLNPTHRSRDKLRSDLTALARAALSLRFLEISGQSCQVTFFHWC
jgi:hypothetical protein